MHMCLLASFAGSSCHLQYEKLSLHNQVTTSYLTFQSLLIKEELEDSSADQFRHYKKARYSHSCWSHSVLLILCTLICGTSRISGSPAMADILPVSGTLQFVSNVVEQDIELSVLPDDIPEVAEVSLL